MTTPTNHFKDQTALEHVVKRQAAGMIGEAEIHGTEPSGTAFAGTDAARETALLFLLLHTLTAPLNLSLQQSSLFLLLAAFGWLIWKTGRSAWLAWSHLERLHRSLEEERWEIEHNRSQEREELKALYSAKGFEGQLLEDVLDVLMSDGNRLLKVMVEEELGLSLEAYDHPLRQGTGAASGVIGAALFSFLLYWIWPAGGLQVAGLVLLGFTGFLSADLEGNRLIAAITWNVAIGCLAIGSVKYLLDYMISMGWFA